MIRKSLSLKVTFFSLVMLLSQLVLAEQTRNPDEYFFNQSLGDLKEELQLAADDGKKAIMIMFEADDCPFCARMKKTILNQPDVQDYYRENFLILKMDIEGDVEITDFQGNHVTQKDFSYKQHRVRATPVFAFFDLQGNLIKGSRFTGAMATKEEFMMYGRFVADGHVNSMNFTKYKRSQTQ